LFEEKRKNIRRGKSRMRKTERAGGGCSLKKMRVPGKKVMPLRGQAWMGLARGDVEEKRGEF